MQSIAHLHKTTSSSAGGAAFLTVRFSSKLLSLALFRYKFKGILHTPINAMTWWLGQNGCVLVYIVNFTLNESKDVMEYICFLQTRTVICKNTL